MSEEKSYKCINVCPKGSLRKTKVGDVLIGHKGPNAVNFEKQDKSGIFDFAIWNDLVENFFEEVK